MVESVKAIVKELVECTIMQVELEVITNRVTHWNNLLQTLADAEI